MTSAVRIVIARSWGTKPSRVTRIVYVPGANAIPGMYFGRILVICTRLSAGVGSTVRRTRRGGCCGSSGATWVGSRSVIWGWSGGGGAGRVPPEHEGERQHGHRTQATKHEARLLEPGVSILQSPAPRLQGGLLVASTSQEAGGHRGPCWTTSEPRTQPVRQQRCLGAQAWRHGCGPRRPACAARVGGALLSYWGPRVNATEHPERHGVPSPGCAGAASHPASVCCTHAKPC